MKRLVLFTICLCWVIGGFAQEKEVFLVDYFSYTSKIGSSYPEQLRNAIIGGIAETGRLSVVDVDAEANLKIEAERRSSEGAMADETARTAQMKTMGANYLLTAHVANMDAVRKTLDNGSVYYDGIISVSYTPLDVYKRQHYAYLKIAEGCNRTCSYCAIPLMTGKYKSREMDEILEECRLLVRSGVKEILVMAQDLTYYGTDLYGKNRLAELIDRIADIEGLKWIKLHYAYPAGFPLELLAVMRERKNAVSYTHLHLPLLPAKVG